MASNFHRRLSPRRSWLTRGPGKAPLLVGVLAPALVALVVSMLMGAAAAATTTRTFAVDADAYVSQAKSKTNYGTASTLKIDAAPLLRTYLRFNLQGIVGTVTKATLRVNTSSGSSVGFAVRGVTGTSWSENSLSFDNAPAISSNVTGSSGSFSAGQWVSVDVTQLVTVNGPVSLALTTTSNSEISLNSREAAASVAPQLIVESTTTAPSNSGAPVVSGTAQAGQTLSVSTGTWAGTQPISYAYQWRRCDTSGGACVDVFGATAASYQLTSVDVGATLLVLVTASNSVGSGSASSAASGVVSAAAVAPSNSGAPVVSGTAQAGQTLSVSTGTWAGTQPISYAYQWRRCDTSGGACVDVFGRPSASYQLTSVDVGATLLVLVTASNSVGSGSASSAASGVVSAAAVAPSNSGAPVVSGTAQAGQTLSVSTGTWAGTQPISYAYQWRRCDTSGGACVDVFGATAASYQLTSVDVGATLLVLVTASNSVGSGSASSAASGVVSAAAVAPSNTGLPVVSGTAQAGQTLSASAGSWSGTQPISFAYQWRRCDTSGGACVDVFGATAATLSADVGDVGGDVAGVGDGVE